MEHLNIHLEWCDDNGEKLKELAETGEPFSISLVPILMNPQHAVFRNGTYPENYYYNKDIMEFLKDIPPNYPHITFGQQGFSHYCSDCYKTEIKSKNVSKRFNHDPWHENRCLYNKGFSIGAQMGSMAIGKEIIEEGIGTSPIIYVSPNHQSDKSTKIATRYLGYEYFSVRSILPITPYSEKGLKIIPERKIRKNENVGDKGVVYIHYDQMNGGFKDYEELGTIPSKPLTDINYNNFPSILSRLNDKLVIAFKRARDLGLR